MSAGYRFYINQNIIDCLIFLHAKGILDNLIICGSLGLVLNDVLKRPVKDIDFLTIPDWYGGGGTPVEPYLSDCSEQRSHRFQVGDVHITCWKIKLFDTKIDLLHNSSKQQTIFEEVELLVEGISMKVKLEDPAVAISFKEKYVIHDNSEESRNKHYTDLKVLNNKEQQPEITETFSTPSSVDDLPF